ncbi:hypothetical protein BT93_L4645 [Corymbia citriodora subsp. variegata]|uniref:F-box associated beta-propeller type 1 domain-containing protein n=1 Tax=Corymbia citriodora subsp. variegata TaxID=360336 RepID=A0A8T0CWF5_CORYI|nr:hypothetical protein BT93_L4645 [Corymbia citriodora subsp. variegata]
MESKPGSGSQSNTKRKDHPGDHSCLPPQSQSHSATISTLPREIIIDILLRLPTPSLEFHPPFATVVPDFNLVGSSEGLLCLANALSSHDVYVYNPLTGEYKEFPNLEDHQRILDIVFGFGFDEIEKDYKVIKIVYPIRNHIRGRHVAHSAVQVCSLRNPTWRRLGTQKVDSVNILGIFNPLALIFALASLLLLKTPWTSLQRKYWNVGIVSFDMSDEQFKNVPTLECMHFSRDQCHLVELGGCLSAAVLSVSGALEIWVMKEYGMQESWVMDYNIGSYLPRNLHNPNDEFKDRSSKDSRILTRRRSRINVRVLAMLRNGEILLEYHNRALVRYDPNCDKAVDLMLEGLPKWFESIVHVSSISRM